MSRAISKVAASVTIVVVIAAAVLAGYFALSMNAKTSSGNNNTISVGLEIGAADASDVPMMYSLTNELPNYGYHANVNIFTGPSTTAAAVLAGTINFGVDSPPEVVNLAAQGQKIVAFGVGYQESDEILVCNTNITSLPQLAQNHITVGMTSLTDGSYYVPAYWLSQNGYNPSSVNWIVVPGAAGRGAALLSGKIPCGATDVTSTLTLLAQPNNPFHIVAYLASLMPAFPFEMWWTTASYYNSHCTSTTPSQNQCMALLEANMAGYRWAQTKSNYLGYAPSVVGSSINSTLLSGSYDILSKVGIWNPNLPWNTTIATTVANVSASYHLVAGYANPNTWANYTIYQMALAAIGTYS